MRRALDDAPVKFPPEEWFAAVAGGRAQRVAFRDVNGDAEFVRAEWLEENLFELKEPPLLVDGVSVLDGVEVEWRVGDVERHFLRRVEDDWNLRTIRTRASPKEAKRFLKDCDDFRIPFEQPRYERGILVTAIRQETIEYYRDMDQDVPLFLPGEWVFTDTGTQD